VQYDQFVAWVEERARLEREDAERASLVVVEELCNRLTADEAHDLLSELPRA
jgi:uncharacterized protein (DUF2267 family)